MSARERLWSVGVDGAVLSAHAVAVDVGAGAGAGSSSAAHADRYTLTSVPEDGDEQAELTTDGNRDMWRALHRSYDARDTETVRFARGWGGGVTDSLCASELAGTKAVHAHTGADGMWSAADVDAREDRADCAPALTHARSTPGRGITASRRATRAAFMTACLAPRYVYVWNSEAVLIGNVEAGDREDNPITGSAALCTVYLTYTIGRAERARVVVATVPLLPMKVVAKNGVARNDRSWVPVVYPGTLYQEGQRVNVRVHAAAVPAVLLDVLPRVIARRFGRAGGTPALTRVAYARVYGPAYGHTHSQAYLARPARLRVAAGRAVHAHEMQKAVAAAVAGSPCAGEYARTRNDPRATAVVTLLLQFLHTSSTVGRFARLVRGVGSPGVDTALRALLWILVRTGYTAAAARRSGRNVPRMGAEVYAGDVTGVAPHSGLVWLVWVAFWGADTEWDVQEEAA